MGVESELDPGVLFTKSYLRRAGEEGGFRSDIAAGRGGTSISKILPEHCFTSWPFSKSRHS